MAKQLRRTVDTQFFLNQAISLYRAWVSHILRETRILQVLKKSGSLDTHGLSIKLGFNASALNTLCEAAYALGVLELSHNGEWQVKDKVYELLVSSNSKSYVGGTLSYVCLRSLDLTHFIDLLKGKNFRSNSLLKPFKYATEWDHTVFFDHYLSRNPGVKKILMRGAKVLDVGCGDGSWAIRLAKLFPNCELVGLEPSEEARMEAVKKVLRNRLDRRAKIISLSIEELTRKSEFDLCYMGEMLYSLKDKREALARVYESLKAEGVLLIQEGLLPDETRLLRRKEFVLGAAEQLDFLLQGAKFMRKKEVGRLLTEAGFRAATPLHLGGGVYIIQTKKLGKSAGHSSTTHSH
jgi:ubiquinone/menaquinone biosynthesis C-methylase UbiE